MIAVGQLSGTLYGSNIHGVAELYTLSGSFGVERWTSADSDIVSGSTTWISTGPAVARGALQQQAGLSVATMDISIYPGSGALGGVQMAQAAVRGDLDGAHVTLQRAFFSGAWGSVTGGLVNLFEGDVSEVEPGATEIRLVAKSVVERMNRKVPFRIVQPGCPYALGDISCGVSMAAHTVSASAASGSTASVVRISGIYATGYFDLGVLTTADGTKRSIVSSQDLGGSVHAITLDAPLAASPPTGSAITATRGCDKKMTTCRNKFSNLARYGGFPTLPKDKSLYE